MKRADLREIEDKCFALCAQGLSNRAIAKELGVGEGSVSTYIKHAELRSEYLRGDLEVQWRAREVEKLDQMQAAIYEQALGKKSRTVMVNGTPTKITTPDLAAMDMLIKIGQRRALLLGLDAPRKSDVRMAVTVKVPPPDFSRLSDDEIRTAVEIVGKVQPALPAPTEK